MPITSRFASAAARAYGMFSNLARAADPYFRNTTLLLPGNGTNGAQNNTFLDSSSNAFTITRNGNTTQGTFTPFSQTGWGNYFGGSSDYINFASSSALSFASDFTVEAWVYNNYSTGTFNPAVLYDSSSSAISSFEINNGTNYPSVAGITATNTVTRYTFSTGPSVPVLQWVHVAWVRSSGTVKVYVNGTASTSTLANSAATGQIVQVANGRTSGSPWNGYISNLRITSSAVYTSNFTPSSVPLTAISGTQLLTCQANRFVDASSNALSPTLVGTPSVQAFSPFAPTAAYSASTVGGSGYFDGSGDYLTAANSTAFALPADFTVEAWVYFNSNTTSVFCGNINSAGYGDWAFFYNNAAGIRWLTDNATTVITGTYTMPLNAWTHVAISRSGTSVRIFANGALLSTTTNSSANSFAGTMNIGRSNDAGLQFPGYMTDLRIVKGTAVYTAAFTPPTAPLTAISGTSLLLSATNGGIVDATAKNDLETVGNAQISTTQSKFGGSSMYFDGTGDYLSFVRPQTLFFGTGDYTIEFWFYNSAAQKSPSCLFAFYTSVTTYFALYNNTAGNPNVLNVDDSSGTPPIIGTTTLVTGQWYHCALSRYNGSTKLFLNGVQEGSTWSTTTAPSASGTSVRIATSGTASTTFTGYIDDFRITTGIARYTSNFTPPTSAFLLQ